MKSSHKGLAFSMVFMTIVADAAVMSTFLRGDAAPTLDDTLVLSRNLQTCSLGEDVVKCDSTSRSCAELEIQGCIVYCTDSLSCARATMKNCSVFCQSDGSCSDAIITDSHVECSMQYACLGTQIWYSYIYCGQGWACSQTQVTASVLSCPDPAFDLDNCQGVEFKDQCTCSDDLESPKCTVGGGPSEEFCSSESAGVSCATLGNPICSDMPGHDDPTESDSAATVTSKPEATGSTSNSQATSPPTSTSKVPIVAIVIPVVVAVIGLIAAVVNRKKIVHVVNHYKAGTGTKGAVDP